jgi:hypothetical protein
LQEVTPPYSGGQRDARSSQCTLRRQNHKLPRFQDPSAMATECPSY